MHYLIWVFFAIIITFLIKYAGRFSQLLQCAVVYPPPFKFAGDLLDMAARPYQFGPAMRARHGPVYIVWLGLLQPVVVIASRAAARTFYTTVNSFLRPKALGLGNLFDRYLGQCMGAVSGDQWVRVKKAFNPAMKSMHVGMNREFIEQYTSDWLDANFEPLSESGEGKDASDLIANYSLFMVQSIIFGDEFAQKRRDQLDKLASISRSVINAVFQVPMSRYKLYSLLPTETNRSLKKLYDELRQVVREYDQQMERKGVLAKVHREDLTEDEFLHTLVEIVFANQDVLIPSGAWLLTHMSLHADKLTDCAPMEFIKESARIAPIFPQSMRQYADRAVFGFPAWMSYCLDFVTLNRDPEPYPDPLTFDPARFRGTDDSNLDFSYPRFGLGARRCPGRHLADLYLAVLVEHVAARYRISILGGEALKHTDDVPLAPTAFLAPNVRLIIQSTSWTHDTS